MLTGKKWDTRCITAVCLRRPTFNTIRKIANLVSKCLCGLLLLLTLLIIHIVTSSEAKRLRFQAKKRRNFLNTAVYTLSVFVVSQLAVVTQKENLLTGFVCVCYIVLVLVNITVRVTVTGISFVHIAVILSLTILCVFNCGLQNIYQLFR